MRLQPVHQSVGAFHLQWHYRLRRGERMFNPRDSRDFFVSCELFYNVADSLEEGQRSHHQTPGPKQ